MLACNIQPLSLPTISYLFLPGHLARAALGDVRQQFNPQRRNAVLKDVHILLPDATIVGAQE